MAKKASPTDSAKVKTAVTAAEGPTTCEFATPLAWETWLTGNHHEPVGVWLKIAKKGAAVATVTYGEALDLALCFGWIDGQRKALDEDYFTQRFTPRRKRSMWSKRNVGKAEELIKSGRMRAPGLAEIETAKADGRWERAYAGSSTIQVPSDFQAALRRNKTASLFFESLNKSQRFPFLFRIESAKLPDTRARRITQFVVLLASKKTL